MYLIDKSPKVKGFNKVYHFIQQMLARHIQPKEALEALAKGAIWRDKISGAIVRVLGENVQGTVKVIIDTSGKIVTAYRNKLTGKFERVPGT